MAVDKNLFMYDLAVVAIMKNEGPYIKEWLDYHLLAGVNHFYIYDNESPDNQKEVLQPYIKAGVVTYIFYPGKARQYEAYFDAIQNYRFFCRYMAFIDGDEFIFPKNNRSVVEVLDEILSDDEKRAGLVVNWHQFGSNFQENADLSRGVLERFTRRASDKNIPLSPRSGLPAGNAIVKSILNPRKIHYFFNPHFAIPYLGLYAVNENGEFREYHFNNPPTVEKIVINHYGQKSREEYEKKVARGAADSVNNVYEKHPFEHIYNDEVDEEILKYLEHRKKIILPKSLRKKTFAVEKFPVESETARFQRISKAAQKNLLPENLQSVPKDFFKGKLETFLICLAVSEKYKLKFTAEKETFAEYALYDISQTLDNHSVNLEDSLLLLSALPDILKMPYEIKENIRKLCIEFIPNLIELLRTQTSFVDIAYDWQRIIQIKDLLKMLESFDAYKKK